ncbi:MAG TPA: HAMP domain-containing sensor histidine kinase [bacterium]|nr:HAMP domain-containing sensor histidine kinase [bacterium]
MRKTIGVRLTAWYMGLFIVSSIATFGVTYFLLASFLQQRDQESILSTLQQLASEYRASGLEGLKEEVSLEGRIQNGKPFFIRVADSRNKTLFVKIPNQWSDFEISKLDDPPVNHTRQWIRIPSKNDKAVLEIATMMQPGGAILQVGRSTEERDGLLERFRWFRVTVMIVVVFIGMIVGMFLAKRTLRPIHHLIEAVRATEAGAMDSRVPTRQTGDELDELSMLFNNMLGKIAMLVQGMRDALDNVAHDLRTPVARMRGIAEVALRSEPHPEIYREALADCLEESEGLLTMLNTLMDISEAETGAMKLNLETVNLYALLEDAVDLYRHVAEEKEITLSLTVSKELEVTADRNRMRQVLANLLDNAIKFTPPEGKISLIAYAEQEQVVIVVEDTGIGIPSMELPKIWDRLYRGNQGRSQRGLGLGLSLVKAVVQAHGGSVDVSNNSGIGSRFTLLLPASAHIR